MDWVSGTPDALLAFYTKHFLPISFVHDEGERAKADVKFKTQERLILLGWHKRQSRENIELTGSRAEGLAIPDHAVAKAHTQFDRIRRSDFDEMTVYPNLYITQLGAEKCCIFDIEETDDPRYVKLRITSKFKSIRAKEGKIVENVYYPNSVATSEALKSVHETSVQKLSVAEISGPSACSVDHTGLNSTDTVFCYRCDTWPATEWLSRPRPSGWPSEKQIQEAVQTGCHVAPVGRLASKTKLYEWRYSFSLVERMLAHSLTDVQRKAYIYLKMLSSVGIQSSVVSTYHLKNLFFRSCETFPLNNIKDDNVYTILVYILDQLIHSLATGYLQHYFFCESNMLAQSPRSSLRAAAQASVCVRRNILHYLMVFEDRVTFIRFPSRNRTKVCDIMKYLASKEKANDIAEYFNVNSISYREKCLSILLDNYLKSLEEVLLSRIKSKQSFQLLLTINLNNISACLLNIAHDLHKIKPSTQSFIRYLAEILIEHQPSIKLITRLFLYLKSTEKCYFSMSLNAFLREILSSVKKSVSSQSSNGDAIEAVTDWADTIETLLRSDVYPDDMMLCTDSFYLNFENHKWNWCEIMAAAKVFPGFSVESFEKMWKDTTKHSI